MANYTLTANGSTAKLAFQGDGSIAAYGTFDGATITVEASFDGGVTWIAQTDGTFIAAGSLNIRIGPCHLRFTLSSAGTTDIDISIVGNDVRKSSRID